jgi:hypothetical protein
LRIWIWSIGGKILDTRPIRCGVVGHPASGRATS